MKTSKKTKTPAVTEPDMVKFTCQGCGFQGFDLQEYFTGTPSTLCLWCRKYPKPKNKAAKASDDKASDTSTSS